LVVGFGSAQPTTKIYWGTGIMRYAVLIERGSNSYGAYVPDLPGCVAIGESIEEVRQLIQEAIEFHLEGLREDGSYIPEAISICEYVQAG
jgi:predicted RNase H-like HicB family nuclease